MIKIEIKNYSCLVVCAMFELDVEERSCRSPFMMGMELKGDLSALVERCPVGLKVRGMLDSKLLHLVAGF